jgi:hypothetical protein
MARNRHEPHATEQIVQFSNHVASVSQVLADSSTDLDNTLGTLSQAFEWARPMNFEPNRAMLMLPLTTSPALNRRRRWPADGIASGLDVRTSS